MSRYKCLIQYDGTAYSGWQSQSDGTGIQDHIEAVLTKIAQNPISISGSGRTDAGVHARGQVFHFDSDAKLNPYKWKGALNGLLPKDMHILDVEEVDEELFHARFCVKSKTYEYLIHKGEYDIFSRNHAYQCKEELDVEAMKDAARVFIGKHDFSSFCANPLDDYPDQVRTVTSINIVENDEEIRMIFSGDGFLRYQVRMMSAALIEIGAHRMTKEELKDVLEAKDKQAFRKNAPAHGLTLVQVEYFELLAKTDVLLAREPFEEECETYEMDAVNIRSMAFPFCFTVAARTSDEVYQVGKADEEDGVIHIYLDHPMDTLEDGLNHYFAKYYETYSTCYHYAE